MPKVRLNLIMIAFIVLALAVLIPASLAAINPENPGSKDKLVNDLSALSGLPDETVIGLVYAVGDVETVKENIFIYKRLFDIAQLDDAVQGNLLAQIEEYQTSDLLSVYEFVYEKGFGLDQVEPLLKEHTQGKALDEILTQKMAEMTSKVYRVYQPADKEQVRKWLIQGYLPRDIMKADAIASEKDIKISDVLALKTGSAAWEKIEARLGYQAEEEQQSEAIVNIQETGNTHMLKTDDYAALVREANEAADRKKLQQMKEIARKTDIPEAQMEDYIRQGFNIREVENAFRLSEESGTAMEEILQEKKDGMSWESLIEKYHGTEGKETE